MFATGRETGVKSCNWAVESNHILCKSCNGEPATSNYERFVALAIRAARKVRYFFHFLFEEETQQ